MNKKEQETIEKDLVYLKWSIVALAVLSVLDLVVTIINAFLN